MSVRRRMEMGELYTDHCEGLPEERRAGFYEKLTLKISWHLPGRVG